MEARSLLTALRAAGRTVAVVGDQLVIEGPLTAALRSAVVAQRSALLELLAEPDREPPAPRPAPPASQAEIAPVRASWAALAEPPPPPASSLLPLAPRVAGIAVATPETLRWMACAMRRLFGASGSICRRRDTATRNLSEEEPDAGFT